MKVQHKELRVYLVYDDSHEDGRSKLVAAKNREDAKTKVDFPFTNVSWRPWIKFVDGKFVDESGKEIK